MRGRASATGLLCDFTTTDKETQSAELRAVVSLTAIPHARRTAQVVLGKVFRRKQAGVHSRISVSNGSGGVGEINSSRPVKTWM